MGDDLWSVTEAPMSEALARAARADSKPYGDSCIGTSQTCHKTGGCACNGFEPMFSEPVK